MTVDEMKDRIVEDGWCVVEEVIPSAEVEGVRESILATAVAHRLADPRRQLDKVSGLINYDQSFAPYLAESRFLGLCQAILGPHLRVSYTTCMVTHPGHARGAWHADWPFNQQNAGHVPAPYPDAIMHLTTIWMLTGFSAENGTRIVPGTHRESNNPSGANGVDPLVPHPQEMAVTGAPGSVLVMDSRLWHAISPNQSDHPRVALPIRFAPWWLNLESLRPGSDERARLTQDGLQENTVPPVPPSVFAALPEAVKPLFRHWVERN